MENLSIIIFENTFEHGIAYRRPDGQRMEVTLTHLPGQEPKLQAALFPLQDNPNCEPSSSGPELSIEEVRLRYEFYRHLKEAGLLDEK